MHDKRIVIVDDDESIRKTFSLLLSGYYNIFLARDAREALTWLESMAVDMIIADLRLPQKNGIQMLLDFRQAGYHGKIILISAFPDQIKTEDLASLKVDRLFIKPLDLRAMTEAIDFLLKQEES
jgi:DNA-binding response OmpR family regulator